MEVCNYELKSKLNDKFLKTVSSFGNYNDGRIIFGVDNEGNSIGLDDLEIESKLDHADDFSKNHDKRLSHDEVFNSIRLKLNNI